jgi:hypothetical protein
MSVITIQQEMFRISLAVTAEVKEESKEAASAADSLDFRKT